MYEGFINCIKEQTDVRIEFELIVASIIKNLLQMRDTHDNFFLPRPILIYVRLL